MEQDYKAFDLMSKEKQLEILELINWGLTQIDTINTRHTSYGLKHIFEKYLEDGYISNGEFKGAMLHSGYRVHDLEQLNWCFNISEKSLILSVKKEQSTKFYSGLYLSKVYKKLLAIYFSMKYTHIDEFKKEQIQIKKIIKTLSKKINPIHTFIHPVHKDLYMDKELREGIKRIKEVIREYEQRFNTRARCYNCKSLKIYAYVRVDKGLNVHDWEFSCKNCEH